MSKETAQGLFFENLYEQNFDKLKLIAYAKLKNDPVSEELAQATFLTALRDFETLRRHENPEAYLRAVLKYKILEYIRARNRYLKLFLSLDHNILSRIKAPSNPAPTSTSSIMETVRDTLSAEEWDLLKQYVLDGASHRQIASKLGITVQASQKRLERIRKKLEDVLPDY